MVDAPRGINSLSYPIPVLSTLYLTGVSQIGYTVFSRPLEAYNWLSINRWLAVPCWLIGLSFNRKDYEQFEDSNRM